jgi:hypothetical protein
MYGYADGYDGGLSRTDNYGYPSGDPLGVNLDILDIHWISTWISSKDVQKNLIRGTYPWKLSVSRGFVWICTHMFRYPYISARSKFSEAG